MANPRQRRKARSGSHKAVRHSNHAKKLLKKQPPIQGPKVLQDTWDKRKTVRQNYEALGLLSTLNPTASGGTEGERGEDGQRPEGGDEREDDLDGNMKAGKIGNGRGRILRDENGEVIGVELGEEEDEEDEEEEEEGEGGKKKKKKKLPGTRFEEDVDLTKQPELEPWMSLSTSHPNSRHAGPTGRRATHVVQTLEEISKSESPIKRFTSSAEANLLRQLVAKHGHDLQRMAHDRKLNPDQRTVGQLRRAIQKAGGLEALH